MARRQESRHRADIGSDNDQWHVELPHSTVPGQAWRIRRTVVGRGDVLPEDRLRAIKWARGVDGDLGTWLYSAFSFCLLGISAFTAVRFRLDAFHIVVIACSVPLLILNVFGVVFQARLERWYRKQPESRER